MRQACLSQTVLATAAPAFQGQWNDAHSDCTSTARRLGNAAGCPPSADGAAAGGGEAPQGAVEQLLLLLAGAGPGASSQATLARAEAMAASLTAEQLNLCPASSRLPSASLLTVAASSSLDEAMLVKLVLVLMRHGADPAAHGGWAVVKAVEAGRLAVADAMLSRCPGGGRAVAGLALLPLLQDAITSPALPHEGQAVSSSRGLEALALLLRCLPPDHVREGMSIAGLTLPQAALQVCATRVAFGGLSGVWLSQEHASLLGMFRALTKHMREAALQRTLVALQLLIAAGAPPVPQEQEGAPGLPPDVWQHLREAATAWPEAWSREAHRRYHPAFKAAARALLLAARHGVPAPPAGAAGSPGGASCRRQGSRVYLPPLVTERIIQLMATKQSDWVRAS